MEILVTVNNKMQTGYTYKRVVPPGRINEMSSPHFTPAFTPKQMLQLGVFEGKYMNDCTEEYGDFLYEGASLSDVPNPLWLIVSKPRVETRCHIGSSKVGSTLKILVDGLNGTPDSGLGVVL